MRKAHIYRVPENSNGMYRAVVITYEGGSKFQRSMVGNEERPEELLFQWRKLQLEEKSDVPLR